MENVLPIVKDVFQIFISDSDDNSIDDPSINENIEILKDIYSTSRYHLLNNADIRSFIASEFSSEILAAYENFEPYAYRADLARYCLMYVYGGLYSDLTNRFIKPLKIVPGRKIACFRDYGARPWGLQNGIIYAEPRREEFKRAIELVVRNSAEGFYGAGPIEPTGPLLMGRAFAICNQITEYSVGEWAPLSPGFPNPSSCFSGSDGEIFAIRNKKGIGDLSLLNLKGANNYVKLWHQRKVYKHKICKNIQIAQHYFNVNGFEYRSSGVFLLPYHGCQVFGPYIPLCSGSYRATFTIDAERAGGKLGIDVFGSAITFCEISWFQIECAGRHEINVSFELAHDVEDLEMRLFNDGRASGMFADAMIDRWSGHATLTEEGPSISPIRKNGHETADGLARRLYAILPRLRAFYRRGAQSVVLRWGGVFRGAAARLRHPASHR